MSKNFSEAIAYKIHKAVFVIDKTADSTLQAKMDLTLSQFLVLMHIVQNPGLSQIQIAGLLEVTQAAISRQTDVLINKNLLSMKKNEENRREHLLFPTALGQSTFDRSHQILNEAFEELYSIMSEKEKENLEKSLDKLLSSVCGKRKSWDC